MTRFALDAFGVSNSMFYWTDQTDLGMRDVTIAGNVGRTFDLYRNGMYRWDPLGVPLMIRQSSTVSLLTDCRHLGRLDDGSPFAAYLEQTHLRDVMEFLFWHDNVAVAGLAVLEAEADPRTLQDKRSLAAAMHRFMEFTLSDHPRIRGISRSQAMRDRYRLSVREMEVADLVSRGLTNQDLADELGISTATVKTHMTRIFEKVGVENRASLAALLTSF